MSRVRVAAATCLVASGLFVGGFGGAVAFAGPDESDGAGGNGAVGDGAGDVSTGTADPGSPGGSGSHPARPGRLPHPPRVSVGNGRDSTPPKAGTATPSKQSATAGEGASDTPGTPPGEPRPPTDAGGAGPPDAGGTDDPDDPDNPDDPDEPDDCDKEGRHCLPWWWPKPGVQKSGNGNGGLGSAAPKPPAVRSIRPPVMQLPRPVPNAAVPAIVDPLPVPPAIELPALPPPPAAAGGGSGGSGATPTPTVPTPPAPRTPAPPPPHPPAQAVDRTVLPVSYRAGYGEYLRTADMPQVIAVAVPGATGIMLLTAAGGIIGYRQARSALAVSSRRSARFTS